MFSFPPLTPFLRKLLIGLAGFYVAELILQNWLGLPVYQWLALTPTELGPQILWQVFTHVLVWPPGPEAVFGVMISLVFLWWMIAPFEARFGERRTLQLCLVSALAAALPALIVGIVFPQPARLSGTSPLLLGAIGAFAWSLRGRGTLSFFGVLPMRPEQIILLVAGVSVVFFLASRNVLDLVANLGALAGGVGFVQWMRRPPRRGVRRKRANPFRVVPPADDRPRWLN